MRKLVCCNNGEQYKYAYLNCVICFLLFFFVLFVTPLLSIPFIGLCLILLDIPKKYERFYSAPFLIVTVLIFVLVFSLREYGFRLGDTADDVPGYYLWYLKDIGDRLSLLWNREFAFWLPFIVVSFFRGPLDFQEFTLLANAYFFTILFFVSIRFGKLSVIFVFIFFFLFHANIYGFAHLYRQTLALLFLLLAVGGYVDGSNKKFYFFSLFSFFSHNASILLILPLILMTLIKQDSVIYYLKFLFSMVISSCILYFTPNQFVSEVFFKLDLYTTEKSVQMGFDFQSTLIILLNVILLFNTKNIKVRCFVIAVIFVEVFFISIGIWAFLGRINILTLPLTVYVYFYCINNDLFYLVKSNRFIVVGVTFVMFVGLLYTLRIGINNLQAIVPLLANGDFFNLNTGLVFILQKL